MNKKRPNQVIVRLSDEEFQQLKELVESSGQTQQEYIRKAILGAEIIDDRVIVDNEALRKAVFELAHQGNNLNQLTKKLHEKGYIDYKGELPTLQEELRETWQQLRRSLRELV